MQQKIAPNLWFNGNAQEAAEYYVSVFPGGKIVQTTYYPNTKEEGLMDFQLELAGGIDYLPTPKTSNVAGVRTNLGLAGKLCQRA